MPVNDQRLNSLPRGSVKDFCALLKSDFRICLDEQVGRRQLSFEVTKKGVRPGNGGNLHLMMASSTNAARRRIATIRA